MRFGKTYKQKKEDYQEHLQMLKTTIFYPIAWLPTQMTDGSWIWLERYCLSHEKNIFKDQINNLYYRTEGFTTRRYSPSRTQL